MTDLYIERSGEVRLGPDVAGELIWARPTAHYDVAGEWYRDAPDECHCCIDEIEWEDAQIELEKLRAQNARLRARLAEVRAMLVPR